MVRDRYGSGRSLKNKIILFNVLVVTCALFLFCMVFLTVTSKQLKDQTLQLAQVALDQTTVVMEEQAQAFRNSIDNLTLDEDNIELFNRNNEQRYQKVFNWNFDYQLLQQKVDNLLFRSNISRVKIVTENAIAQNDSELIVPLEERDSTRWYQLILQNNTGSYLWTPTESLFPEEEDADQYVLFTRNLPYTYQNYRTYYVCYVKKDSFDRLLEANVTDRYTSYYVQNCGGEFLFGKDAAQEEDSGALKEWIEQQYQKSDSPIPVQPVSVNGRLYYVGSSPIANTDLTVVYTCSFYQMNGDNMKEYIFRMGLIALAVFPLVLFFSAWIAHSITKSLEQLKANMMQVSEGNFDIPIIQIASDSEVRALTRCFNYMLEKISTLLDAQYNYGKQIKELELKSLQAQINPHFLYNTLELIKWKAVKYKDSDIQNIVTALSNYYRRGLSKGADMVTLQSELEHVTFYTEIQNMRFDNCVQLTCRVSEDCRQCVLPKLTLQPLVENGLLHGILETDEAEGEILIRTFHEGEDLYIVVVDNGCGMMPEKAAHIIDGDTSHPTIGSGYGIRNIHERIKLVFGSEYGLSFLSYPDCGTAAILKIPYHWDDGEKG